MAVTIALIDCDALIFRAGFAVEHTSYNLWEAGLEHLGPLEVWESRAGMPEDVLKLPLNPSLEGLGAIQSGDRYITQHRRVEPLENCLQILKTMMEGAILGAEAKSWMAFIKGTGNFRDLISATRPYKGNRDPSHRPVYEGEMREYLRTMWAAEVVDGEEVDDRIAQMQVDDSTCICSIDKDFNQVVGWHYNFLKREKFYIGKEEAVRNFYIQLLTGDASDNIQGIPKVGPRKASKILGECKSEREMYDAACRAYQEAYGENWELVLTEMANLVYLRRERDVAWKPPA